MRIDWTEHAEMRLLEWSRLKNITRAEVEANVEKPDQIVKGHEGLQVAQSARGEGLLRIPFAEAEGGRKIVTLYWTSQVARYWEEPDANSI